MDSKVGCFSLEVSLLVIIFWTLHARASIKTKFPALDLDLYSTSWLEALSTYFPTGQGQGQTAQATA